MQQLTLDIQLNEYATLDNFTIGRNEALINQLMLSLAGEGEQAFYLWGACGVGRTHLLQACCHYITQQGRPCAYLPLNENHLLAPDIFNELESLALVCLDDIDAAAGKQVWEEALFHFYNRAREHETLLIISSASPLQQLNLLLPDLKSRLSWGLVYQVHDLPDPEKCIALITRAKMRGLNLPITVAQFLLSHCSRNMADLSALLNKLDKDSLTQKRPLTIPFVKSVLDL